MTHGTAVWKILFGSSRTELCGCVRARWVLIRVWNDRQAFFKIAVTTTWLELSVYRHFLPSAGRFRGGPGSPRRPHVLPVGNERRLPEHGQPSGQRLRWHGGWGRSLHRQWAGRDYGRAPAGVGHQPIIGARNTRWGGRNTVQCTVRCIYLVYWFQNKCVFA